ncbi:MAG TPA: phosphotransferase, partial [Candidatus Limnocylindrales bacterium]
ITDAQVTGTGFTAGFAALLTTASGERFFVKAAPLSEPASQWYAREAALTSELPLGVPSARLLWSERLAGYFVLCLEAIEGARVPSLPWDPAELDAALDALAAANKALSSPPAALIDLKPDPWSEVLDGTLDKWRTSPPDHPQAALFASLEARFDEATRDSKQLMHCDLRLDNIVLDTAGKAWICDWNFLSYGPPWLDALTLLVSAEASGLDPDPLFWAHPVSAEVTPELLDSALAAMLGYYLHSSSQPEIPTSPNIRSHQRYYASLTSRWLARHL